MRVSIIICCFLVVVSPVFAAHPLGTDDPGTVARGAVELEQIIDLEETKGVSEAATTFTFGITDNLDAGIGLGYNLAEDTGFTDPGIGAKWRFAGDASTGLSLALSTTAVLGDGFNTTEFVGLLLSEYRMDNKALLFNVGRTWVNEEIDHVDWGAAIEVDTSPYMTLVAEATNQDYIGILVDHDDELEYLVGALYTDSREYVYSAGLGYRPNEDVSNWRLTTGVTITF